MSRQSAVADRVIELNDLPAADAETATRRLKLQEG
jgi:hypothetical protein